MLTLSKTAAAAWVVFWAGVAMAQLAAGDIAFVAYNTDGEDDFTWVALRRIPAGTIIHFTDMSVSNGGFRLSEHLSPTYQGPLSWSHTNAVDAGTVIRWVGGATDGWTTGQASGGAPSLSSDGDQLVAYCGTIVSNAAFVSPWLGDACGATLLYALNFANSGWDPVTGGDTQTSDVPPGVSTNAGTAVHVGSKDNGYYSGITCGTAAELLAAIANSANWTMSNDLFERVFWTEERKFQVKPRGVVLSIR